jgi:hypothetical protein
LVQPPQRVQLARAHRPLDLRVEGRGPRVLVTGSPRAAPGASVAHDEQRHPRVGAGQFRAQPDARAGRLVLADRLKDTATLVPRLVEEHRAEPQGQRRRTSARVRDHGREDGRVQPVDAVPGAGNLGRPDDGDHLRVMTQEPPDHVRTSRPEFGHDRVTPGELRAQQRRRRTQRRTRNHRRAPARKIAFTP